jgi:hypothetical protein
MQNLYERLSLEHLAILAFAGIEQVLTLHSVPESVERHLHMDVRKTYCSCPGVLELEDVVTL